MNRLSWKIEAERGKGEVNEQAVLEDRSRKREGGRRRLGSRRLGFNCPRRNKWVG